MSIFRRMTAVFLLLALPVSALRGEDSRPPNVVILLADDIRWSDYGFMGHKTIQTPHLDRLARESLVFTRGYVPTSLCRPSLASLITGLYPHQHLITGNDPARGTPREEMLRHIDRCATIPKLLHKQGYASLQTGKWWEGNFKRGGFTHGQTHGDPTRGGRHGDEGLKIGREGLAPIRDFLDEVGEQPFFLWYAPLLPHQPHNPPERLLAKYRDKTDSLHIAKYWAMVEWWDETCGELLAELAKRKLADNTLVVYLADNGWVQNPHKPVFAERSKRSHFDGGLRTPIMLRWPGQIEPQREEVKLASSIDLAPTILAACGVKPADEMQGLNLLSGKSSDALFGAIFEHDIPDIQLAAPGLLSRWCIAGRWKLVTFASDRDDELFDVLADPEEQHNLATSKPELVVQLRAKIDGWWKP